jgi:hypothetical protein
VQYAWIQHQHTTFRVSRRCWLLEVSRRGYDEWLGRPPCAQAAADQALQDKSTRYFAQGRGTYGTRRIKQLWAQAGWQGSRRSGRGLVQAGRRCKTRRTYTAPTTAGQAQPVAPNQLKREFTVDAPNKV